VVGVCSGGWCRVLCVVDCVSGGWRGGVQVQGLEGGLASYSAVVFVLCVIGGWDGCICEFGSVLGSAVFFFVGAGVKAWGRLRLFAGVRCPTRPDFVCGVVRNG